MAFIDRPCKTPWLLMKAINKMPKASLEEGANCLVVYRLGASYLDVIGCGLCASETRDVDVKS